MGTGLPLDVDIPSAHGYSGSMHDPTTVWFHRDQLLFKPHYEWALGQRIDHPETTARAESIVAALSADPAFAFQTPQAIRPSLLRLNHDPDLLTLLKTSQELTEDLYVAVFPKHDHRADPTNLMHTGAWCFDAGTPLNGEAWMASRWSASAALAAAQTVAAGAPLSYSLSRPPGHHAQRSRFGGYCYLNNAAVAARFLSRQGRVAVLDIDYHHGNGTQDIFFGDPSVLTMSIHADPVDDFPFFAGFASERGIGPGEGFNINLPEERGCDGQRYLRILEGQVYPSIRAFSPEVLVLAAGLDGYFLDPLGKFTLTTEDFREIGAHIGRWGIPVVAVQEGGYHTGHLGRNVCALLHGLRDGLAASGR